jgi:ankyrin repeat protein
MEVFNYIMSNDFEKVKEFIQSKDIINICDKYGNTALFFAVRINNIDIIKYLIENGADLNAKNEDYESVLHYAAYKKNNLETIKYLIENGADTNILDYSGRTPLSCAIEISDNSETINYFTEYLQTL